MSPASASTPARRTCCEVRTIPRGGYRFARHSDIVRQSIPGPAAAFNNGDWDIKTVRPKFIECSGIGNKRNFRVWKIIVDIDGSVAKPE